MSLAETLGSLTTPAGAGIHRGKVQSASGSTVVVRIGADTTDSPPLTKLASYSPAVDDEVLVLLDGGGAVVLGKLG